MLICKYKKKRDFYRNFSMHFFPKIPPIIAPKLFAIKSSKSQVRLLKIGCRTSIAPLKIQIATIVMITFLVVIIKTCLLFMRNRADKPKYIQICMTLSSFGNNSQLVFMCCEGIKLANKIAASQRIVGV